MVALPPLQYSAVVGLLLSDGWLVFASNKSKNARLGFKQSYSHYEYVWFTFFILSHYCNSLPVYKKHVRNGVENYSLEFTTRSLFYRNLFLILC